MKAVSIIAVLLLLAANAFALLLALNQFVLPPAAEAYVLAPKVNVFKLPPSALSVLPYVAAGSLALGVIALIAILAIRTRSGGARAARPMSASVRANQAEAEIVSFLATLQSKGRLVDFLMDDINAFNDAQVGAAARIVHAGCKAALAEHFRIAPIRAESEGATVQVPAGYAADEYRLLGKISGQAPFAGVLVHHGWRTDQVKLPRILRDATERLPTIAPAEVELK